MSKNTKKKDKNSNHKTKKNIIKKENKDILEDTKWRMMRLAGSGRRKLIDYVIAIPSYKRAETLRDNTLTLLRRQKIPPNKIYIFVGNQDEYEIYKKVLPKYYNRIVVGVMGISNIRNFITDYFGKGQYIFNMDDDIIDLLELDEEKDMKSKKTAKTHKLDKVGDLENFINKGFKECRKTGFRLFGIYPASNPFFMKKRITYDLRYIVGSCWGCINDKKLKVTMDNKEDYERTLKYYRKYGGVIRFENITIITQNYKKSGGRIKNIQTEENIYNSALKLEKMFPDLCRLYLGKKSGYAELKLKDKDKIYSKYDTIYKYL